MRTVKYKKMEMVRAGSCLEVQCFFLNQNLKQEVDFMFNLCGLNESRTKGERK